MLGEVLGILFKETPRWLWPVLILGILVALFAAAANGSL